MFPIKLSRLLKFSNAFLNDLWGTVRNNTDVARQKWFAKLTKSQKRVSWTLKLVVMKGINSLIYLLRDEKKEKKVFATVSLWSAIEIFYRDWDFECCDFLFASKKKKRFHRRLLIFSFFSPNLFLLAGEIFRNCSWKLLWVVSWWKNRRVYIVYKCLWNLYSKLRSLLVRPLLYSFF